MATPISTAEINSIRLIVQGGAPASPPANRENLYIKSGGLYRVNSSGAETQILDVAGLTNILKSPPAIGSITPNTGAFSSTTIAGLLTVNNAIGTPNPQIDVIADGLTSPGAHFHAYGSTGYAIRGGSARGALSGPLNTLNGYQVFFFSAQGHDGNAFATGGRIYFTCTQDWTGSARGMKVTFGTVPNGSTTIFDRAVIENDGQMSVGQNMPAQFPVGIDVAESTHASSRNAAVKMGNNWKWMQDLNGNGTRDFCLYYIAGTFPPFYWDGNAKLTHIQYNAATAALFQHNLLDGRSTGTAAAGFGIAFDTVLQSSTTIGRDAGRFSVEWIVATDASRTSKVKLWAADSSAWREGIAVGSSGSAAQVGFYGTAPIIKPAASGSRGANAALASLLTALANLGLITDSTSA